MSIWPSHYFLMAVEIFMNIAHEYPLFTRWRSDGSPLMLVVAAGSSLGGTLGDALSVPLGETVGEVLEVTVGDALGETLGEALGAALGRAGAILVYTRTWPESTPLGPLLNEAETAKIVPSEDRETSWPL